MEIYAVLTFIVFLQPLDCISAPGPMGIYWDYCYFCMPAQTPTFSQNDGNYAKLYIFMQNVLSSRITQDLHKSLILVGFTQPGTLIFLRKYWCFHAGGVRMLEIAGIHVILAKLY